MILSDSAGVGRTGTFIALYNIMRQAEETGLVDFFKTVSKLREDRIFMVQTLVSDSVVLKCFFSVLSRPTAIGCGGGWEGKIRTR